MDAWLIWAIVAMAAAVGEVLTAGFFLAPFAIGAAGAAVADLVGAPLGVELAVFFALTIASLGLLRPVARRHLRTPPQIRTNTAALIGRPAVVLDRVDDDTGRVRLEGEVWSARLYEGMGEPIEPGTRVQVVEIRGATALVTL